MARPSTRTRSVDVVQALVDAAERVLVRNGSDAVTVRAVAAEAAVAPMGIYNHLGGKDGLLAAVLVRGFDGLTAATEAGAEDDPLERLLQCGLAYREFALAHPQHYALMFEGSTVKLASDPGVQAHAVAAFSVLVSRVEYAMARGAIRRGDSIDLAQQIWNSVHGAVTLERHGLALTPDPGATYRRMLDLLIAGAASVDRPHPPAVSEERLPPL